MTKICKAENVPQRSPSLLAHLAALSMLFLFTIPLFVIGREQKSGAGGLIPCDGPDCTFDSFLILAQRIINLTVVILVPYTALGFAWAGWLFMSAGGDETQISRAKDLFVKLIYGFIFILSAWIIVRTITSVLLEPQNYTDLLERIN